MLDPANSPRWLLRQADQTAVAASVAITWMLLAGWWFWHGGYQGRLLEIDRATPLAARFEVDINAADMSELMQLPGVGPKLAGRIVASRESDGPFTKCEDLLRIRGIGPKILERLSPFLRSMGENRNATAEEKAPAGD